MTLTASTQTASHCYHSQILTDIDEQDYPKRVYVFPVHQFFVDEDVMFKIL
jgi:hypothetical protein